MVNTEGWFFSPVADFLTIRRDYDTQPIRFNRSWVFQLSERLNSA